MVIQRQPQPLIVFPVDVPGGYAVLFHSDAIGNQIIDVDKKSFAVITGKAGISNLLKSFRSFVKKKSTNECKAAVYKMASSTSFTAR